MSNVRRLSGWCAMHNYVHFEPSDVATLASAVATLESRLINGIAIEVTDAQSALAHARACRDDTLVGRTLCLLSRALIIHGEHELALEIAVEAARTFAELDAVVASQYPGVYAEAYRAAGSALLKLGRTAQAFPELEQAVGIAQAGIGIRSEPPAYPSLISAESALLRSLVTLGITLFAIREIDAAIQMYYRAMTVADAHPQMYEQFIDDVMLVRWNLTDALHERADRRRSAGESELAEHDIAAARDLLDGQAWRVDLPDSDAAAGRRGDSLGAFGRATYYAALGRHLLVTAQPAQALSTFRRVLAEIERQEIVDEWGVADAHTGMAQAALALGSPRDALDYGSLAASALDRHDESNTRAAVLLVRAKAHRALGEHEAAYDALEKHHLLRTQLEAVAAQQYASHMTARLGLERARADAESHRAIASMLETLGRVGQEITAKLNTEAILEIFARYAGALLEPKTFNVWILNAAGARLMPAFGPDGGPAVARRDINVTDPESLAAKVVRERREIFEPAGAPPMQTMLFMPLIAADRIFGVASIASEAPDAYDDPERSIFRTLSSYAAIALDNAAAYTNLEQTIIALQLAQSKLAKQTAEFERLSMTDALTGVANRRHLDERAQVEIASLLRKPGQLAVAMFDIDHFKSVNDSYGHAVGDAMLLQIATVAKQWLRPADLISRIGGEEFALLLPGVGMREAVAIAERIRSSIAEISVAVGDATVRVTSSFGVATLDANHDTLDQALKRADAALYAAKRAGRNRVHATLPD